MNLRTNCVCQKIAVKLLFYSHSMLYIIRQSEYLLNLIKSFLKKSLLTYKIIKIKLIIKLIIIIYNFIDKF